MNNKTKILINSYKIELLSLRTRDELTAYMQEVSKKTLYDMLCCSYAKWEIKRKGLIPFLSVDIYSCPLCYRYFTGKGKYLCTGCPLDCLGKQGKWSVNDIYNPNPYEHATEYEEHLDYQPLLDAIQEEIEQEEENENISSDGPIV
jgi:hypothetical protein